MIRKHLFGLGKPKANRVMEFLAGFIAGTIAVVLFTIWFMDYLGVPFK